MAISLLLAVGCNRPEAEDPVTPEKPKGKYELKELTATLPEADTKTSLDSDTKVAYWNSGDLIVVIGTDGTPYQYQLSAGAGSPHGKFVPVSSKATYTDPSDLTAIYPACAVASANSSTATIRINSDLSENYLDYGITSWNQDSQFAFAQNDIKAAKPSAFTTGNETTGLNFRFKQLGTWCNFTFDFANSPDFSTTYDMGELMQGMTVTTTGGDYISGTATLDLSDLSLGAGDQTSIDRDFYNRVNLSKKRTYAVMMFPSVRASSTLHITLRTDQHTFDFYGSPVQDFTAGTVLEFPIVVDKNFSAGSGTLYYTKTDQNRAPFYYYGVQNCFLLESSETNPDPINTTPYCTDIYYHRSNGSGSGATPAAGAKLLWEEDNELITDVSYNESNKTISYSRTLGHYGNAVIALTDGEDGTGKILWSYHIWCPEDAPKDLTYKISMNGEHKTLMSMQLGATKDIHTKITNAGGNADGYGLYYQWGRKDPLGRTEGIDNNNNPRTCYDADGNAISLFESSSTVEISTALAGRTGDITDKSSAAYQTIAQYMQNYAREHPATFIRVQSGTYDNNWAGELDNYFWGNYRATGSYPTMVNTYKSIFDPCPAGYRVAPEDTWVGFTTIKTNSNSATTWNMANNGNYIAGAFDGTIKTDTDYKLSVARGYAFCYAGYASVNTDFYPASGIRDRSSHNLYNVGVDCRMWASSPGGQVAARYLLFNETNINVLDGGARALGAPLRCAKEP